MFRGTIFGIIFKEEIILVVRIHLVKLILQNFGVLWSVPSGDCRLWMAAVLPLVAQRYYRHRQRSPAVTTARNKTSHRYYRQEFFVLFSFSISLFVGLVHLSIPPIPMLCFQVQVALVFPLSQEACSCSRGRDRGRRRGR